MRRFVLAAFALTVLAACQPATTELTEEQKAEIAAEVALRLDQLWDELRQPDYDRLNTFFHQEPDVLGLSNGTFIEGSAAMDRLYRPVIAQWADQVLTVSATRTLVLSPDIVYTLRVGTDSITMRSGEATPTRPWAFSAVWMRSNGEWKVHSSHGSHPSPLDQ